MQPVLSEDKADLTIGKVPVKNLWLLMLYASDLYRDEFKKFSSVEDAPDEIPDLVSQMLCQSVQQRLRRNLTSGYITREDRLKRLRGRIDLLETARHRLLQKGQIACSFEEMTINTPRNRYIKAALEKLSTIVSSPMLARSCRSSAKQLYQYGVIGPRPDDSLMSKEIYGRHDAADKQLVALASFAFDLVLPSEQSGSHLIQAPNRDVTFVRKLFEKGVAGLYKANLSGDGWIVSAGRKLNWEIESESEGINSVLPSMRTDIELRKEQKHIVIDTKFNSILTRGWYRENSLRSGYIYQMYTYLRSQEKPDVPYSLKSTGMLLHPCIDQPLNEQVTIQGHTIRFVTIDLTQTALAIKNDLLKTIVGHNE
ncbi:MULTISPECIES: 5-methylcytosine-specific restriction endonuclease system specificity protein McrC [unclassified Neptuniibacter]|uniref:5-methylcytosine-specific restriction endonuclease system specificity protein McrC n=1 Tax=unclassified Neptuniibacter TaxID=2630693 RepID=UPI000C459537|nr:MULTISPECIES: 5-methylcytosine-specific restriction endonuclease system specificity protein McrC [unclassified Neptuniibacter]MAY43508.1 5-methylcytosine-specific restriction endonuclease system specificity protein McrC [Oceanospirillaceae bacterium]|tara:strand:- start:15984 stop:17087 length:1104 start_codon:yes stop_codon:yes gene_type:complete